MINPHPGGPSCYFEQVLDAEMHEVNKKKKQPKVVEQLPQLGKKTKGKPQPQAVVKATVPKVRTFTSCITTCPLSPLSPSAGVSVHLFDVCIQVNQQYGDAMTLILLAAYFRFQKGCG